MTKGEALKKMQAVKAYMTSGNPIWDVTEIGEAFGMAIEALEQPEQRWIPCGEKLPEDDTLMLVNYVDHRPDAMDIWIGWHEMENVWYIDGEAHSEEFGNEVVAWMPLPKPYKVDE